jgi:hypothetical protein
VKDALEARIGHADCAHVIERVADVVHAGPALADSLRHQSRASMQVELTDVRRTLGVGEKCERAHASTRAQRYVEQARRVDAPRHLTPP